METVAIKCSNCTGITEVDQSRKQGLCQYCGDILEIDDLQATKPTAQNQSTTVENDARLEALKMVETYYFNGQVVFEEVLKTYEDAEVAGAKDAEFWLARARFLAIGSTKEFEAGRVSADERETILTQYIKWMDEAIISYLGNVTRLKIEKEKTIGEINNTFAGRERRVENEAWAKAMLEEERQEEVIEEAELAAEELEDAVHRNHKRNIFIIIASVLILLLLSFLLLRSCGRNDEEVDVTNYEKFLELSYMLDLFNEDSTRDDILDLDLDFGTPSLDAPSIRIIVPEEADLDRITFHFDEDDLLIRISVDNANHFNEVLASEGVTPDLFENFDAAELDEADHNISGIIDDLFIAIRLTPRYQFSINISRLGEELTAEQQEIWNLIEERIAQGYDSWADLLEWADQADIPVAFLENDETPTAAIRALIEQYGLVGDYIEATPGLGILEDPEEVLMLLHFENLTYNLMVAELSDLNQNSNRELNSWLENSGRTRLDAHFGTVEIIDLDEDGEALTDLPEVVEFVSWEIEFVDLFKPAGMGRIRIERTYRVLEIEEDEEEDEEEEDEDEDEDEEDPTPRPPSGRVTLSAGDWIVGEDVAQGRFVISGDSTGSLTIWRGEEFIMSEILGGGAFGVSTVNTYLLNGDRIVIHDINNTIFNPVANRTLSNSLTTGNWVVGVDIAAGTYEATVPSGIGSFVVFRGSNVLVNEILEDGSQGLSVDHVQVTLIAGDVIMISGVERVNFE